MFIVTADAAEAFGPFNTREAAEYFVQEMPADIASNVINRLNAICNGPFLRLVE